MELARRALPSAARPLLNLPTVGSDFSPGIDVHLFTSAAPLLSCASIHRQAGRDFAARLENAIEKINELGHDEIVIIGRDCPSLRPIDIEQAFEELGFAKTCPGPDHRGGCYLIAFRLRDRDLLHGVRWKRHTDCEQLRDRCRPSEVSLLPLKHELDSWADRATPRSLRRSPRPARFFSSERGLRGGTPPFFISSIWPSASRVRQQIPLRHSRFKFGFLRAVGSLLPPPDMTLCQPRRFTTLTQSYVTNFLVDPIACALP